MTLTHKTHADFQQFMAQLLTTNADLAFYTDFHKCTQNVNAISIKLNQLNYLIGKDDLDAAVRELWNENPKTFNILGMLIAVRDRDKKQVIDTDNHLKYITDFFTSPEGVIEYLRQTGLEDVFKTNSITNLVDYVFGIEVGLDTNARKNRSGHIMERHVANILTRANIQHETEVCSTTLPGVDIALGEDVKRFDFVIRTTAKTYLTEVNFYSSGGSKLNEVARAYTELAPKINGVPGYEFVWITDGIGWNNAKGKLEEAYLSIPHVYNLTSIAKLFDIIRRSSTD